MKTETAAENLKLLQKGSGRLYLLCVIVGALTGFTVSLYRWVLNYANHFREFIIGNSLIEGPKSIFLIWISFILIGLLVDFVLRKYPKISGSGIPQVKGILLRQLDYVKWFQELIAKFITGLMSIGAGLSLGREGPSVQLGSYIGFGITKFFKRDDIEKKYLVTSGASAGLAGAFGAPLSGVIFALEELHKYISAKLLICTFLASIASDFVGRRIFGMDTSFNLIATYPKNMNPYYQFILYILLGIIIAFFGKLFTFTLVKVQDTFQGIKTPRSMKIAFVMSTSMLLCYFLPEVTGGGHELVEEMAGGNRTIQLLIIIFLIKLLFTALCYATGFAGGIFLPMLVLGAIIGKIYGLTLIKYLGIGMGFVPHFMVLGMAAYFVAVVRAPITGAVLILEMTGNFDHLLALVTVSVVAYYVTELLGLEPIYEILFSRMKKDVPVEDKSCKKKTIITVPVAAESELDNKKISEINWEEDILVVAITRGEHEIIPKGNTVIKSGDLLTFLLPESKVFKMKELLYKKGESIN
ncbi:ClC family H(+)/Cl(-) exchange transporter [uncultured Fusobacterium sp.]|uniref:ClC family H(+)/Cl(-) exchange transporter n=1 Tax=uncultured Fusobacterium sp. TaxID=159267 RepID=UPI0025CE03DA|nr:ClC family H(+)/Cl(-) exchange transporter [uncultured Fusobacterium sp.]